MISYINVLGAVMFLVGLYGAWRFFPFRRQSRPMAPARLVPITTDADTLERLRNSPDHDDQLAYVLSRTFTEGKALSGEYSPQGVKLHAEPPLEPGPEESEFICAAAIRFEGRLYVVPAPARHHDIIRVIATATGASNILGEQGFVTGRYHFVDREEAGRIALQSGQVSTLKVPPNLYSEDLW